ncbi:PH domain-containing protein [Arthrobacter sp. LAPM80]|uniref:PH domain-containing protein n=1 Tax=Arthrobacter sp. LAPM80 TaxID=3141788 RepID=UPI00398B1D4D
MPKWLLEDEQVELRIRPHPRPLIWPITVGLMLLFIGFAGLGALQPVPFARWAPGAAALRQPAVALVSTGVIFMLLAYPVRRVLRWVFTRYVLTNQRLLVRRGVLGRIKEIHVLEQVQEVRPVQNWRQKMVGSGDLQLHMYRGPVRTIAEVPVLNRFNSETQQAWTKVFRESIQQSPRPGD